MTETPEARLERLRQLALRTLRTTEMKRYLEELRWYYDERAILARWLDHCNDWDSPGELN